MKQLLYILIALFTVACGGETPSTTMEPFKMLEKDMASVSGHIVEDGVLFGLMKVFKDEKGKDFSFLFVMAPEEGYCFALCRIDQNKGIIKDVYFSGPIEKDEMEEIMDSPSDYSTLLLNREIVSKQTPSGMKTKEIIEASESAFSYYRSHKNEFSNDA